MKYLLLALTLTAFPLYSDTLNTPWGKDADLASRPVPQKQETPRHTPLNLLAETVIAFHQNVISPADGPRSHFIPSSSQYTLEAIRKHGFYKGFILGCDRLMRENSDPWIYRTVVDDNGITMKYDPVK